MGKGVLGAQRSARAPQVTQDWVLQVPWGHSPQTCSSPVSPTDTSRVASAFKCNLKGNKGLIHLPLKTVFSHILLLARPPSWAIAARSVTRAQLLEAPSSKRAGDVNILFFISFFFSFPLPPIFPFLHHSSLGPRWNTWPSHFWFHLLAGNLFVDQQGKVTQQFTGRPPADPLVMFERGFVGFGA